MPKLFACDVTVLIGKRIALWNPTHKRFIRMPRDGTSLDKSAKTRPDGTIPLSWTLEVFKVVDGGDGLVGLWNPTNKRFIRITDTDLDKSDPREDGTLPSSLTWERFKIVYTDDGKIGLWNPTHKRFVRMPNDGTNLDRSEESPDGALPSHMLWESFEFMEVPPKPGTRKQERVG